MNRTATAPWVRSPARAAGEPPPGVLWIVCLAIALIPAVKPRLPGNSGPADVLMLIATVSVALWVSARGRRMMMPYLIGTVMLMTAGGIAGMLAGRPGSTLVVLLQETFLFLFCAAVATVARTPRAIERIKSVWVASAVAWGILLIVAVTLGIASLVEASTERGTRAHLFFQNPNITGNFFMVAAFVAIGRRARSVPVRLVQSGVLVTAMLYTGSNAALIGFAVGATVTFLVWVWKRLEPAAAIALAVATLAVGAAGYIGLGDTFRNASDSEQPLIKYSIGRLERSAENRQTLFASEIELYQQRSIWGIGPFATRDALGQSGETGTRSSHNDYLATLIERGPLGVLGLLLLIGSIVIRSVPRTAGIKPAWARTVGTGATTVGVMIALALSSTTHEILHYRHLWALLGLVAATHRWSRQDSEGASS